MVPWESGDRPPGSELHFHDRASESGDANEPALGPAYASYVVDAGRPQGNVIISEKGKDEFDGSMSRPLRNIAARD